MALTIEEFEDVLQGPTGFFHLHFMGRVVAQAPSVAAVQTEGSNRVVFASAITASEPISFDTTVFHPDWGGVYREQHQTVQTLAITHFRLLHWVLRHGKVHGVYDGNFTRMGTIHDDRLNGFAR